MALKLDDRNANLRGRFLVEFAARFGIPESMSQRRLNELAERVAQHIADASVIGFDDRITGQLIAEMNRRLDTLRRFE